MAEGYANPATEGKDDTNYTGRYIEAIERYDRATEEWKARCEKIIKIYLDQHRGANAPRRFALLWANIETLKPAYYARLPQAVVSRRYKDQDKAGKKASEVLERCINTTFDLYGVDEVMQLVRDDRLLCSRGQAWVRYEADTEDYDTGDKDAKQQPVMGSRKKGEKVCFEFVHWNDFGHSMHRIWPEVNMVWRRVYMTKAKVRKRWDKKTADKLHYEVRQQLQGNTGDGKDATEPQAIIHELWDKDRKRVCWLAKEEKLKLEDGEPPLDLRGFFPCPKPVYGSKATGSLIPTPDYRYYQDQAEEIDDLTQKIADLTSWVRLRGFIPGGPSSEGPDAIKKLLEANGNQTFVTIESWAGFAEKGGAKGLIEWLPLDMVMNALQAAIETRRELKDDVYEISGISDILRGETDPDETLGAQQLKAQTGSRRISTPQRDLARFARDLAELAGEIIAEHFDPETMGDMSGFDMTVEPPPQLVMQAKMLMQQMQQMQQAQQMQMQGMNGGGPPPPDPKMQQAQQQLQEIQGKLEAIKLNKDVLDLLRDERTRGFRIEIENESTIEPDEQAEKQRRVEFLEAVGQFLERVVPMLQTMPQGAQMVGEMLLFMVRGFRAGRQLEDVIEQATQKLMEQAQQPPPPDPKLEAEKVKAEAQVKQIAAKGQMDQQKHGMEMEKMQVEGQQAQAELVMDRERLAMEGQQMAMEGQQMERQAAMEERSMDRQAQAEERSAELQGDTMQRKHDLGVEAMETKAKQAAAKPKEV